MDTPLATARRGSPLLTGTWPGAVPSKAMVSSREDVLLLLDEHARRPRPSGPVALGERYLEAVERWEALPENAERAEKGWVLRADRSWRRLVARARLVG